MRREISSGFPALEVGRVALRVVGGGRGRTR
jgi:hypothetical protein